MSEKNQGSKKRKEREFTETERKIIKDFKIGRGFDHREECTSDRFLGKKRIRRIIKNLKRIEEEEDKNYAFKCIEDLNQVEEEIDKEINSRETELKEIYRTSENYQLSISTWITINKLLESYTLPRIYITQKNIIKYNPIFGSSLHFWYRSKFEEIINKDNRKLRLEKVLEILSQEHIDKYFFVKRLLKIEDYLDYKKLYTEHFTDQINFVIFLTIELFTSGLRKESIVQGKGEWTQALIDEFSWKVIGKINFCKDEGYWEHRPYTIRHNIEYILKFFEELENIVKTLSKNTGREYTFDLDQLVTDNPRE